MTNTAMTAADVCTVASTCVTLDVRRCVVCCKSLLGKRRDTRTCGNTCTQKISRMNPARVAHREAVSSLKATREVSLAARLLAAKNRIRQRHSFERDIPFKDGAKEISRTTHVDGTRKVTPTFYSEAGFEIEIFGAKKVSINSLPLYEFATDEILREKLHGQHLRKLARNEAKAAALVSETQKFFTAAAAEAEADFTKNVKAAAKLKTANLKSTKSILSTAAKAVEIKKLKREAAARESIAAARVKKVKRFILTDTAREAKRTDLVATSSPVAFPPYLESRTVREIAGRGRKQRTPKQIVKAALKKAEF